VKEAGTQTSWTDLARELRSDPRTAILIRDADEGEIGVMLSAEEFWELRQAAVDRFEEKSAAIYTRARDNGLTDVRADEILSDAGRAKGRS
jgi:hypothetical protein